MVSVDEVEADRSLADAHLARAERLGRQFLVAEYFRPAEFVDADCVGHIVTIHESARRLK